MVRKQLKQIELHDPSADGSLGWNRPRCLAMEAVRSRRWLETV
jgi:hypothetical protein